MFDSRRGCHGDRRHQAAPIKAGQGLPWIRPREQGLGKASEQPIVKGMSGLKTAAPRGLIPSGRRSALLVERTPRRSTEPEVPVRFWGRALRASETAPRQSHTLETAGFNSLCPQPIPVVKAVGGFHTALRKGSRSLHRDRSMVYALPWCVGHRRAIRCKAPTGDSVRRHAAGWFGQADRPEGRLRLLGASFNG